MKEETGEFLQVSYNIEKEVVKKLENLAKRFDVNESSLVNKMLKESLRDLEEERKKPKREEIITQPLNI